jgi:hypothetical protein
MRRAQPYDTLCSTALSPGHGPSSFHRPPTYDNSGTLGEAGLSADSVTGHIFAGVSKHGPGMYILRPVLGDMQALHASPAQPNQWNALRRLGSNSASAKAGLLLLVSSARYGGGLYLTGLVWMLL